MREAAHLALVERCEHVVRLLRANDSDDEFQEAPFGLWRTSARRSSSVRRAAALSGGTKSPARRLVRLAKDRGGNPRNCGFPPACRRTRSGRRRPPPRRRLERRLALEDDRQAELAQPRPGALGQLLGARREARVAVQDDHVALRDGLLEAGGEDGLAAVELAGLVARRPRAATRRATRRTGSRRPRRSARSRTR